MIATCLNKSARFFSLADECKPFETCSHVRAVTAEQMEIVLDSGADVSALPLRFGTIGKSCPQPRPLLMHKVAS